jgi:hypothetical protein
MPTLAHQPTPAPWETFPAIPPAEVQRLRRINWASPRREAERDGILALSDERQRWQQLADQAGRRGYAQGAADTAGYCEGHQHAVADAFAAGQRAAAADARGGTTAMHIGWNAALDRFANEIGSRHRPAHVSPAELRTWTRHSPKCVHGGRGGQQHCKRSGCLPGPRAAFGERAPWDETPAKGAA